MTPALPLRPVPLLAAAVTLAPLLGVDTHVLRETAALVLLGTVWRDRP